MLLQFGVQLAMYATPVIYPLRQVPQGAYDWLKWNPLSILFEGARSLIFGEPTLQPTQYLYSLSVGALLLLCSVCIFNHTQRNFIDSV